MKTLKVLKINLLVICMFVLFSLFLTGEAVAATYYVATNGSDSNNGSATTPWATFCKAMTVLQPGDTLMIKNGTYYQSLAVTVSGVSGNPITIKAQNDGQAIIDGEFARRPCQIVGTSSNHKHDIIIEGIRCQKSNWNVVEIQYSDRVTLKRVSAYDTDYNAGSSGATVFLVTESGNIVLEDCAASGWGRDLYEIYDSNYVTVRRCFGMWKGWWGATTVGGNIIIQVYGTNNSIIENFVGFKHPQAMSASLMGANIWCNSYNNDASNNKYLGAVIWGPNTWAFMDASANHRIENNEFTNIVSIDDAYGFYQRGDVNLQVKNATFVNATKYSFVLEEFPYEPKDTDYEIRGDVRNSNFVSNGNGYGFNIRFTSVVKGFTHDYNNLFNFGGNYLGTSAGAHKIYVNPNFNTSTYGKGAYLMVPSALKGKGENGADIGAEVLYQYKDGVLTNVPLWPWPMEDRIKNETGYSVTYENAGGLWKTLNGVYGSTIIVDTTPPSTPTALAATVISSTQINLSWVASTDPSTGSGQASGVAGYKIYRCTGTNCTPTTQIATTSNTNYPDNTGLSPSTAYTYTVSAYDAAGNNSSQSASASATTNPPQNQSVVNFILIDADTNQDIGELRNGDVLNLATLPTRNLNVRASTNPGTVGSVRFDYDGTTNYRLENGALYALAGDNGNGDYYAWTPALGSHTLTATPFSGPNVSGVSGTALTISFEVVTIDTTTSSPPTELVVK